MNSAWAFAALAAIPIQAPDRPRDDRRPIPDAAAQKKAEALLLDIFKDEYARKTPADKQALAKKLLEQASGAGEDPESLFVLLREARDLAAQGGNSDLALDAADRLSKAFRVDPVSSKLGALASLERSAAPEQSPKVLEGYLRLADEAAEVDDFAGADKAAAAALAMAKRLKDLRDITQGEMRRKEVAEQKARYLKLQKSRLTLQAKPDDPEANLLVGEYECFAKGNWSAGLATLAKGKDAELRVLAQEDLENPQDASRQAAIGDGWWKRAEKTKGAAKVHLRGRALYWYEQAAKTAEGLAKIKVDRRVLEIKLEKIHRGTWLDVTDPAAFGLTGKVGDPVELNPPESATNGATVDLLQMPQGEFDGLTLRFRSTERKRTAYISYDRVERAIEFNCDRGTIYVVENNRSLNKWVARKGVGGRITKSEAILTVILSGKNMDLYVDGERTLQDQSTTPGVLGVCLQVIHGKVLFDQIKLRKKE